MKSHSHKEARTLLGGSGLLVSWTYAALLTVAGLPLLLRLTELAGVQKGSLLEALLLTVGSLTILLCTAALSRRALVRDTLAELQARAQEADFSMEGEPAE